MTPVPEEAQRLLGGALHYMRELILWVANTYTPDTTHYIEEQLRRADTHQTTQWFQASINVLMPQMGVIYVPPFVGETAAPTMPSGGGEHRPHQPAGEGGKYDEVKTEIKKEKESDDDKDKADWGGDTEEEEGKDHARPCEIPSAVGDGQQHMPAKEDDARGPCEIPSAKKGEAPTQPGREERTPPRGGDLPGPRPGGDVPGPALCQDKDDEGEEYEDVLVDQEEDRTRTGGTLQARRPGLRPAVPQPTSMPPWQRLRTTTLHHITPSTTTWETLHQQQAKKRDFPAGARPTKTSRQTNRGPCERPSAPTQPRAKQGARTASARTTSQAWGQDNRGPCERPSASTQPQAKKGARTIARLTAAPKGASRSRTPRGGPCATPSAPTTAPARDKPPLPRKRKTGDICSKNREKLGEKVARLANYDDSGYN